MEKENKSKKIHVFFITNGSAGTTTIKQDKYEPITPNVLRIMENQIKEASEISEDDNLAIVCWQRFEK